MQPRAPAFQESPSHAVAMLAKVLFDEPSKLRRVRPEMPKAVEALLDRMRSSSIRLVHAEALHAAGHHERARAAIVAARERLLAIAGGLGSLLTTPIALCQPPPG